MYACLTGIYINSVGRHSLSADLFYGLNVTDYRQSSNIMRRKAVTKKRWEMRTSSDRQ